MKKRILLSLAAVAAIAAGVIGMSAFEAHVINVTAKIENALTVPLEGEGLSFGTVFPEEVVYKNFDMSLSQSFLDEKRVDDVEYILRQKPKCGVPVPNTDPVAYSQFAQVTEDEFQIFHCPIVKDDAGADVQSVMLPLLCPYLSKHELDATGAPLPGGIDAFHGPLVDWTMANTLESQLAGRLSKADQKTSATWQLDLHAPCFQGMCAQDNVIPEDYQADPAYEHQVFGCDLWIEVNGISLSGDKGTLIVKKTIINDNGGQITNPAGFSFSVNGGTATAFEADGQNDIIVNPGTFTVAEVAPTGYTASFNNCTNIDIATNETKTCIITNDDNEPDLFCGDGEVNQSSEQCDDSNTANNDGCSSICQNEVCGDGIQQANETCDDGNLVSGDGCSATCTTEVCGNGTVDEGEQCDDGNAIQGDGCDNGCLTSGTLTVIKQVINDNGGLLTVGSFTLKIDGSTITSGVSKTVAPGSHTASEDGIFGYASAVTGDCNPAGIVNVASGENKTCTITNNDMAPSIQLIKNVIGGTADSDDFDLTIDGSIVSSGSSVQVLANVPHSINEAVIVPGYSFASILGTSFKGAVCPTVLNGTIILLPGDVITCTITNTLN